MFCAFGCECFRPIRVWKRSIFMNVVVFVVFIVFVDGPWVLVNGSTVVVLIVLFWYSSNSRSEWVMALLSLFLVFSMSPFI